MGVGAAFMPTLAFAAPTLNGFQNWLGTQVGILAICVTLALAVLCVVKKEYAKLVGVLVIGGFITALSVNTGIITNLGTWIAGLIGV